MLYIQKKSPGKEIVEEIEKIRHSDEWKKACKTKEIRDCFDRLPKEAIRKQLIEEQHGLCAYCMKRIGNSYDGLKIEHWYPLDKDKERALNYSNYLGVCFGGEKVTLKEKTHRQLCCDAAKGELVINLNPCNENHIRTISYERNGIMKSSNKEFDDEINDILCLNGKVDQKRDFKFDSSTGLVKGRRDAYQQYKKIMERLSKKKKVSISDIDALIDRYLNAEIREEFAGVIVYFLEKRRRAIQKK